MRTDAIDLLRRVPMLRPLPVTAIEQLAQNAERTEVPAGVAVFEAGDTGDRFYVVEEGSVEVLDGERVVRTMGPGEGFGEIALLGSTTRTMTVRAVEETRLLGICAGDFLPAVTGISEARSAAETPAASTCATHRAGRPTTSVRPPDRRTESAHPGTWAASVGCGGTRATRVAGAVAQPVRAEDS